MAGEDDLGGRMQGSSYQMGTLISEVKTLTRAVRDQTEELKKTNETVRDHDEWIAVREDREKRSARNFKIIAATIIGFSSTAAGSLVYLVIHVKG